MIIRLFPLPEAKSGQLSRCHQQHRKGIGDVLRRAAVGDEQIIDGVEGDGRAQQPTGPCDLQPRPLPCVCKPAAHNQAAEDVHGPCTEATEEDEGEAVRAVLDQIAHIFEGGEGEGDRDGGGLAYTWQRTWLKIAGICGLLGAAITLHAIYNLLIAYGGAAQYVAYALPVLLVAAGKLSAFRLGQRK